MELTFKLNLPRTLYDELQQAADDSRCTTLDFAGQVLEAALATRRLTKVFVPALSQGAQHMRRAHIQTEPEDAAEAGLVTHRIILPEAL